MRNCYVLTLLLLLLQAAPVKAQENKFWKSVELGYGKGVDKSRSSGNFGNVGAASLRAKVGYYLNPRLSLGAGIGLNGYHDLLKNTMPAFAEIRYHLLASLPKLYSYADVGGNVGRTEKSGGGFSSGFISDIGLGYRIKLGKRTALNPSMGYNLFVYPHNNYFVRANPNSPGGYEIYSDKITRRRHTLMFRLELEF